MGKGTGPPPWHQDLLRYRALCEALAERRPPRRHPRLRPDGCLLEGRPLLNPVHLVAVFDWPVQRIGPRYRGQAGGGSPVRLALFRNVIGGIDHLLIGVHGEALIAALARRRVSGRRLLSELSAELAGDRPADCRRDAMDGDRRPPARGALAAEAARLQRGLAVLLEQFRARGLVLGSVWENEST